MAANPGSCSPRGIFGRASGRSTPRQLLRLLRPHFPWRGAAAMARSTLSFPPWRRCCALRRGQISGRGTWLPKAATLLEWGTVAASVGRGTLARQASGPPSPRIPAPLSSPWRRLFNNENRSAPSGCVGLRRCRTVVALAAETAARPTLWDAASGDVGLSANLLELDIATSTT